MTVNELREHLDELGLTQVEGAQLLGANARTMRRWIAGDLEVPAAVESALRAWLRLHRAGLAWKPEDALIEANDQDGLALHRYHALALDEILTRVDQRGGPATPWEVDLAHGRAHLGKQVELSFYTLANGGFSPQSYCRRDGLAPDLVRDRVLLEDGYACIARELERDARPSRPALTLGTAKLVTSQDQPARLVLWEQRPFPTVVVIIPADVARAVLGSSATRDELEEFANRNLGGLAAYAQRLLSRGSWPINGLGAREFIFDEARLREAKLRRFLLGDRGPFAGG